MEYALLVAHDSIPTMVELLDELDDTMQQYTVGSSEPWLVYLVAYADDDDDNTIDS